MKVYIQTDIEGVAGFCSFEDRSADTRENFAHRQRMYRLLTGEVNAAVRGAKAAGAGTIYVKDDHGSGYNILFEELESGCEVLHGRSSCFPTWLADFDGTFDALVLVGMHAMGGETGGVCPHSRWVVNGGKVFLSEASMAMALAGDLGVPTVFASGDQVVTGELGEKNPALVTAVVKHSHGPYCCRSLVPRDACRLIEDGVAEGIGRRGEIAPWVIRGPVTLNLLDSPGHIPPLAPVLENPVEGETISRAFSAIRVKFPWNNYGRRGMDYYRFPTNLSGEKPGPGKAPRG